MIRINIIGTGFLDMATGGGLSFKKENHQFRFCDISLGRSVEFTIPSTRHNRRLLGYGDDPAMYGDMMRDKHDVQVIHDFGAFRATLSVTGYEGEAFKCVLFLDTMPWLASIQDKKLADMVCPWTHGIYWNNANAHTCDDPSLYIFIDGEGVKIITYDDGVNGYLLPAINVGAFVKAMLDEAGVPNTIGIPKEYWLIMPTIKGQGSTTVTMASTGTNDLTITGAVGLLQSETVDLEWASAVLFNQLIGGGSVTAKAFKALEDIEVTFPSSFPTDCFLVQYSTKLKNYSTIGGVDQFGNPDPHGGSLGKLDGKTVSLKKGYIYFFAPNPWQVDWGFPGGYIGYKDTFNPFNFTFTVSSSSDIAYGDPWYLSNNMPDMTLFEFLESAALACGMEMIVDESGVFIGYGEYGKIFIKRIKDVLSIDSVSRCVEAWGASNRKVEVCFDSEDYVTNHIRWGYYIDNDTIDGSKENKCKFSEGDLNDIGGILIKDIDMGSTPPKVTAKKPTIAFSDPAEKALVRVPDVAMMGYEDIASDSTCVRLKMKADNRTFFCLDNRDLWLWRGMTYLWTSAEWSDGVLSLTLQKVSQAAAIPATPTPPLPYDAEIEYLESSGTQYINTGIVIGDYTTDVKVELDFQNKITGSLFAMWGFIASGTLPRWGNFCYSNHFYASANNTTTTNVVQDTSRHVIVSMLHYDNGVKVWSAYVDGVLKNSNVTLNSPNTLSSNTLPIFLYAGNNNGTAGNFIQTKIYGFSVEVDGQQILNLIPVRVGTVGYMYDTIGGHLYGNDGTGDFVLGPDV